MSNTINHSFREWKEVEAQLRSAEWIHSGHRLSDNDRERIANAYVLWALCIVDASEFFGDLSRQFSFRNMKLWLLNLQRRDVVEVFSTTKDVLGYLRRYDPYQGPSGQGSFKHYLLDCVGVDRLSILGPIRAMLYAYDGSPSQFLLLNCVLQFVTRLTLNDVDWIIDDNLRTYIDFEEALHSQSYPEELLHQLRDIMRETPYDPDDGSFLPTHSGGATLECGRGKGTAEKWRRCSIDHAGLQLLKLKSMQLHPLLESAPLKDNLPCAVNFVPKGVDKKRVVSMEPIFHQYLQHGTQSCMRNWFRKHGFRIFLEDQSLNRRLAQEGSKYRNFGTIDLSSASDSVTKTLVWECFPPKLRSELFRSRSRHAVLPNGNQIELEKFAPMGSATCFPVECYVFYSICQLAERRLGVHAYYSVYGDDIVVSENIFDEVIALLTALNFTVNEDKTFHPWDSFKESCGIECYLGCDVSPCRLPRFYDIVGVRKGSPGNLSGLTSLCNRLGAYGFHKTRAYAVRQLLDSYPGAFFSYNSEEGIFSVDPTNFHLKVRRSTRYQRPEVKCQVVTSLTEPGPDDIRYIECLERMSKTDRQSLLLPSDRIEVNAGRSVSRLSWQWRSDSGPLGPFRPAS